MPVRGLGSPAAPPEGAPPGLVLAELRVPGYPDAASRACDLTETAGRAWRRHVLVLEAQVAPGRLVAKLGPQGAFFAAMRSSPWTCPCRCSAASSF